MCAIVDANVASEVFGSSPQPAGDKFFVWLNKGSARLVVGGKLLEELEVSSQDFRKWATEVALAGRMRIVSKGKVDARAERIQSDAAITSDDPHILALAQISGTRLLYTNDKALQNDFRNRRLIDNPPGKIYSTDERTNPNKEFTSAHRRLLGSKDLCRRA